MFHAENKFLVSDPTKNYNGMSLVCISLVKDGADAITGGGNVVLSKVGMCSWCLTVCHLLVYPMISLRSSVYSIKLL